MYSIFEVFKKHYIIIIVIIINKIFTFKKMESQNFDFFSKKNKIKYSNRLINFPISWWIIQLLTTTQLIFAAL